ncbi:MAG: response regulator, partial [Bacteroidia bacterium]|nr:response regulator [Bacteroidia bacterium]
MNILIVEDEKKLVEEIFKYLNDFNYQCSIAKSYSESIDLFHEKTFDIIVIDINLPDGTGLQLIQYIKQKRIT